MKRHPSGAEPDADPEMVDIVQAAAEWRSRHDAGLLPGDKTKFAHWLEADERHAEAFAQFDVTWSILDRAREVSPEILGASPPGNAPAGAAPPQRRPRSVVWISTALAAAAAIAIMGAGWWRSASTSRISFTNAAMVGPGLVKRLNLPDGSIVRLNAESAIKIRFTEGERRVALERGEASFTVAGNPARPFIVNVAGVDVRAVGTVFNVALRAKSVEVLVTEGKVRVDDAVRGGSLLGVRDTPAIAGRPLALAAGERVVISTLNIASSVRVVPVAVPAAEIARALAWQDRRLEFDSAPLSEIVAEFNRFNQHQLVVADAALGAQRFGGSFRADDPDTFVRLIEARTGVVVEQQPNATVLRIAK
ncbi:MAG: FecR domain-containing protein [Opitutaceae bacterium]|nr:FecR domain-containing protein [Opitutaceae bacterium]